jgi:hypothetical protein
MKKLFFLSWALIFIALVSAEASNIQQNNTSEYIKEIFPKSCVFSGNFEQKKDAENLPLPLLSNGQLFFNCNEGLIWRNINPFIEDTIYTNSGFNFRLIVDEPIEQLNGQKYTYLSNLLLDILSGDLNAIEKNFYLSVSSLKNSNLKNINTETTKHDKYYKVKLTPKNKNIEKYLASIDIAKLDNHKNETITISINTINLKTTKIHISNIQYLLNPNNEHQLSKKFCLKNLKKIIESKSSCEILKNPKKYISFDSSN